MSLTLSDFIIQLLELLDQLMFTPRPTRWYSAYWDFSCYSTVCFKFLFITHFLPYLYGCIMVLQDDYQRWCIQKWGKGEMVPKDYFESIAMYYKLRESSDNEYADYYQAKWRKFEKEIYYNDIQEWHDIFDNYYFDRWGRKFSFWWEFDFYEPEIKIFGFVWRKEARYDFSNSSVVNRTRIECKKSGKCKPDCTLYAYDEKGMVITKYDPPISNERVIFVFDTQKKKLLPVELHTDLDPRILIGLNEESLEQQGIKRGELAKKIRKKNRITIPIFAKLVTKAIFREIKSNLKKQKSLVNELLVEFFKK